MRQSSPTLLQIRPSTAKKPSSIEQKKVRDEETLEDQEDHFEEVYLPLVGHHIQRENLERKKNFHQEKSFEREKNLEREKNSERKNHMVQKENSDLKKILDQREILELRSLSAKRKTSESIHQENHLKNNYYRDIKKPAYAGFYYVSFYHN